jgi:hypothetical protein
MNFQKHTSAEMVSLFQNKPYQGQDPLKAKILFLSSDANYSPEISEHDFFKYILEYHDDAVSFWKKYKVHHPFLLPNYPFHKGKAGVPFHRNFSKLNLSAEYADQISFIELLDIPTIGNKSANMNLFWELVSEEHLRNLDMIIQGCNEKLIFISGGTLKDMKKMKKLYKVFNWLDYPCNANSKYSYKVNESTIQKIYHFSARQIHGQIPDIRNHIDNFLHNVN